MSEKGSGGNGIGLGTVLFIVFMVLKLTHVIAWSWWWIAAPVWAPLAVAGVFYILAAVVLAAAK